MNALDAIGDVSSAQLTASYPCTSAWARPFALGWLVHRRTLAVAALLVAVGLSCANGFINGVAAYERDTTVFYYPLFRWAGEQLRSGTFPLWCPNIFGGYPLLADSEIGLASPAVVLSLLVLPPEVAFVGLRLLFVSIAAIGAFALARTWRLSTAAASIAGLTFALGSFMQAHMPHENIVRTAAWLPAMLACTEQALRSTGRMRRRWMIAAGFSVGFAGVGLHPEVFFIDLMTLVVYGLLRCSLFGRVRGLRAWSRRAWSVATLVIGVVILGLGLAAVQLVPLAELGLGSARAGNFPYSQVAGMTFTPFDLVQLVLPYVFRGPDHTQWGLWAHWESYLYVGLAPLVLAIVALTRVRRPAIALWALIGLSGLIVSLGPYSPIDAFALLWRTPGLGWLRGPGRFELVPVLALAMLAAHGMTMLQARARLTPAQLPVLRRWLGVLGVLLAPYGIAVGLQGAHSALLATPELSLQRIQQLYLALPHDRTGLSADAVYQGLLWATDLTNPRVAGAVLGLFVCGSVIVLWQFAPWRAARRWSGWPAILMLGTELDLLVFGWGIHPRQSLQAIATPDAGLTALHQQLALTEASSGPQRVLASPAVRQTAPDQLVPIGIQEAGGYSSLDQSRERQYLNHVQRVYDGLLDLWNVRYVIDPADAHQLSEYGTVQYSTRNPLFDSAAVGDNGTAALRLPTVTTVAEVRVVSALVGGGDIAQSNTVGDLQVESPNGEIITDIPLRAGVETMDWGWDDLARSGAARHARVEVAGTQGQPLSNGGVATRLLAFARLPLAASTPVGGIEIHSALSRGRLVIYGLALLDTQGEVQRVLAPDQAKFTEMARDQNLVVLRNSAAYPRAFLVSRARVVPAGQSLTYMEQKSFSPDAEVLVAPETELAGSTPAPLSTSNTTTAFGPGLARVTRYAPLGVVVTVDAPRPSFLVLTDAYYPGWHAYVDGRPSTIMRGDFMFRVVKTPAGVHQVVFGYEPKSVTLGLLASLGAVLASLVWWVTDFWRTRAANRR